MSTAAADVLKEFFTGDPDVSPDTAGTVERVPLIDVDIDNDSSASVFPEGEPGGAAFSTLAVPADLVANKLQAAPASSQQTAGEA